MVNLSTSPARPAVAEQLSAPEKRGRHVMSSVYFWWAICLAWAGVLTWAGRHSMNSDGLSYLDMASEAAHRGPGNLINGYWSPAYSALIAVALLLLRPSPEVPLVHLVNFLVFILALLSFTFFVRAFARRDTARGVPCQMEDGHEEAYILPFGFCLGVSAHGAAAGRAREPSDGPCQHR